MERTTFRRTIATRHLAEVIFMHCRSVCRSVRRFPIHSWGLIQPCVDLHHDTAPSLMIILSRVNFGEMKERSKKLIAIWNHCIEAVASPVLICWTPDYDAKQCKYRTFGAIWIEIYCTTTVIIWDEEWHAPAKSICNAYLLARKKSPHNRLLSTDNGQIDNWVHFIGSIDNQ
jgi:hypothetical protein